MDKSRDKGVLVDSNRGRNDGERLTSSRTYASKNYVTVGGSSGFYKAQHAEKKFTNFNQRAKELLTALQRNPVYGSSYRGGSSSSLYSNIYQQKMRSRDNGNLNSVDCVQVCRREEAARSGEVWATSVTRASKAKQKEAIEVRRAYLLKRFLIYTMHAVISRSSIPF